MRVVEDSHSMVEFAESVVEDSFSMVEDCGARGRRLVFYGRRLRCAW
ncbi:hypothetical protein ACFFIS_06595 [Virgibacillus soli]|uniref:Uncharacterized protein n=1 Tax=Paracerasibacillus soli TaxID=480284 RepID=A0ABU5CSM7_9BACI|nr:hypothetical protein [Virgibacillus soli]MDY0409378.1 hypothetical protein [Virgibacillus soli]